MLHIGCLRRERLIKRDRERPPWRNCSSFWPRRRRLDESLTRRLHRDESRATPSTRYTHRPLGPGGAAADASIRRAPSDGARRHDAVRRARSRAPGAGAAARSRPAGRRACRWRGRVVSVFLLDASRLTAPTAAAVVPRSRRLGWRRGGALVMRRGRRPAIKASSRRRPSVDDAFPQKMPSVYTGR